MKDLLGRVWIADFIFTSCAGPCPQMSRHMQRLQTDLADLKSLRLVSFSVDPERDTPEVLRTYGERYDADPQRWLFLTGPMDRIYDIAIKGFKITVEAARENNQIIHDTRFILVDAAGMIRGYYDSTSAEALERLRRDASVLENRGGA
ncbi:MAG: SCO family protein [Planctomycetes bacterium]|nr:SCO family protein [Planctomycetota bacterium]